MLNTAGRRIYAIGDIHGCIDDLTAMLTLIDLDLAADPTSHPLLIFVGDYTDRGPNSRAVIDALIQVQHGPIPAVFLLGNHDQMFLDYLVDPTAPATAKYHWLEAPLGGGATLASYGVPGADPMNPEATCKAFAAAVPSGHRAFLEQASLWFSLGSYAFVHAGIRPGVPLQQQAKQDLIWIRDPFLRHAKPHDSIVVHGHTPVREIEHHDNRINIDTGVVFGRRLSCLVLKGDQAWDLRPTGLVPVHPRSQQT